LVGLVSFIVTDWIFHICWW